MIAGKRYQGSNVDIWSCGVILFALICGYLPFEDPNTANLYKKILNGDYTIPRFVSSESRDLIQNILNTDPEKRFKIGDIRKHPWFNQISIVKITGGIFIGLSQIPINTKILDLLVEYNFKKDYAVKCINANKHNHVTTSYYLLLKKYEQNGDVSEKEFEYFDDKKINALALQEKQRQVQPEQKHQKQEALNQTMPVKKEDMSLLDMKEERKAADLMSKLNVAHDSNQEPLSIQEQMGRIPPSGPSATHNHGSNSGAHHNNPKELMNKTMNVQKEKMNYSLVEQRQIPPARTRGHNAPFEQSMDKSRIQVCMETSTAEKYAGMNVSYENSFSAIKKDILKTTVDQKKHNALTKEVIPIEEKPNKPKEKFIVNTMQNSTLNNTQDPHSLHLNMTQEVKTSTTMTVEEIMNRTAAQYASSKQGHTIFNQVEKQIQSNKNSNNAWQGEKTQNI